MKNLFFGALSLLAVGATAQEYQFKSVIDLESTPVISQDKTGTCWSYATTSFLESEVIRLTGKTVDLSEMYNVRNIYFDKAENYIMRQGGAQFSQGALGHDVLRSAAMHGLVPVSVFQGKEDQAEKHDHSELEKILKNIVDLYANAKTLSPKWKVVVNSVLDAYLGANPKEFTFEGKKFTPKSFMEYLKINPDNYITLTSFKHREFYKPFILNIPDNYSNGSFYNLPIDELMETIDYALSKGYSIALDCDVSEVGFSAKEGVAVLPVDASDKDKKFLKEISAEVVVNQDNRQAEFENFNTTDDHLMHIVGKVQDQKGNVYYTVKNSWGGSSERVGNNGYIYMSVPYTKMKTISIIIHKDAMPSKTKKNLKV